MKLHLGCGPKEFAGWYHVDALSYPHVDHIGPVEKLDFVEDQTVEIIYACHVLEHFGRNAYKDVLREWQRVLQPGGVLRLAVPDFAACAQAYVSGELSRGLLDVTGLLMGGQRDKYDYHSALFDKETLTNDLIECGFSSVREWDWRQTEHSDIDDYSQSYLPHMQKHTGRLMSLNLEGVR
ncbi:methyltransferase domain-containing protein [Sphingomonas sp. SUN019]|uniref:class I SAM-dependent methyltransferase n=1 Tax=Sphingomonas sp. SUN019 TaxID=2937788 RepID=UPI00216466BF|nr:methyltransferase domain-containing protein [Sphingomonas sp. SUN019]UVO51142.1 methyltransferase domain-containing protein [Sphingomonas sp. SUN019]